MKILCLTTMFERPKVSAVFLEGMKRLCVPVLSVVSDLDSMVVCEKYHSDTLMCESYYYYNTPLGAKWNHGVYTSLDYDYTHLMISGDDDLYSDELMPLIEEFQDHPFLGISSTYMIKPVSKSASLFRYTKPIALGSGRIIRRDVIESMIKDKRVQLYDAKLDKGLDYGCDMRLLEKGHRPVLLDKAPLCVGVKTDKNIWPFENFKGRGGSSQTVEVEYEQAVEMLGEKERGMMDEW